jgi:hypothetical protein
VQMAGAPWIGRSPRAQLPVGEHKRMPDARSGLHCPEDAGDAPGASGHATLVAGPQRSRSCSACRSAGGINHDMDPRCVMDMVWPKLKAAVRTVSASTHHGRA